MDSRQRLGSESFPLEAVPRFARPLRSGSAQSRGAHARALWVIDWHLPRRTSLRPRPTRLEENPARCGRRTHRRSDRSRAGVDFAADSGPFPGTSRTGHSARRGRMCAARDHNRSRRRSAGRRYRSLSVFASRRPPAHPRIRDDPRPRPYADTWLAKGKEIGDFLTVRSIKLLADGALGSRGAALLDPMRTILAIADF